MREDVTSAEIVALVENQLIAYNRRDVDAFCACYHPEVKVVNLISNSVRCVGIEQLRKDYTELFAASPKLRCELRHRIVSDNSVIDEEWVTGHIRQPEGLHAVAIYGFRDGLIDRVWFAR